MYHRSAGKKSTILSIPGNSRVETELLPFFLPQAAGPVKKERGNPCRNEQYSVQYNPDEGITVTKKVRSDET